MIKKMMVASNPVLTGLSLIGIVQVGKWTFDLCWKLYKEIRRRSVYFKNRYGACWVMVTNPTASPASQEHCEYFAKQGCNIMLIGKDRTILNQLGTTLLEKYPAIDVRSATIDFSVAEPSEWLPKLAKSIEGLDVGILLNLFSEVPQPGVSQFAIENTSKTLREKVLGTTIILRTLLPKMLARQKHSYILNVFLEDFRRKPVTFMAIQAFVEVLSKSLEEEFKGKLDISTITDPKKKCYGIN